MFEGYTRSAKGGCSLSFFRKVSRLMKWSVLALVALLLAAMSPVLGGCTSSTDDAPKTKDPTPVPVDQRTQPPMSERIEGPKKGVRRGP